MTDDTRPDSDRYYSRSHLGRAVVDDDGHRPAIDRMIADPSVRAALERAQSSRYHVRAIIAVALSAFDRLDGDICAIEEGRRTSAETDDDALGLRADEWGSFRGQYLDEGELFTDDVLAALDARGRLP